MARKDANPGAKEAAAARRFAAMEYRKAGMTVRAIAKKLDTSAATIHADIKAALKEVNERTLSDAKELQALQWERLDMALFAVAARVVKGDLGAVSQWNNLIKTQCDLKGLNDPKKIAPTTPDGSQSWQLLDQNRVKNLTKLSPEKLALFQDLLAELESDAGEEEDDAEER